jgi:hypothetical protein
MVPPLAERNCPVKEATCNMEEETGFVDLGDVTYFKDTSLREVNTGWALVVNSSTQFLCVCVCVLCMYLYNYQPS